MIKRLLRLILGVVSYSLTKIYVIIMPSFERGILWLMKIKLG